MARFNWQLSTAEEIADEIKHSTHNRISHQMDHYRKQGNNVMLERISKAIKLAKLWKLQEQVKHIKEEIDSTE